MSPARASLRIRSCWKSRSAHAQGSAIGIARDQIRRSVAASAGIEDFHPDPFYYPKYDYTLAMAMKREMELFFDSVVREDRNVLDLLTANYTFVNERLASITESRMSRQAVPPSRSDGRLSPRPAGQRRRFWR